MKYFLIIAISLLFAQPALAARRVSGSVPTTTPLQPMPSGVAANVQNNIQFTDPSHQGQFDANGDIIQNNSQDGWGAGQNSGAASALFHNPAQAQTQSHAWIWWLLGLIIVAGGLLWMIRGKRS